MGRGNTVNRYREGARFRKFEGDLGRLNWGLSEYIKLVVPGTMQCSVVKSSVVQYSAVQCSAL